MGSRALAAAIAAAALACAPTALAGGTQVSIAATASRVWVTDGSKVVELDARGHVLFRVATRYPYPLALGLSDGNVWASSVANGFVAGAVSRIPFDGPHAATELALPHRPVFELTVASGATWALVGPWGDVRLVRIDHATRRVSRFPIRPDLAFIAGDYSGRVQGLVAVTKSGALVRIDDSGKARTLAAVAAVAPPTVGLGRVWIVTRSAVLEVNPATGRVEGRLRIAHPLSVTIGGGVAWVLAGRTGSLRLFEVDPRRLRVVARSTLPAVSGALAYGNGRLWLGTATPHVRVLEIDPLTLRARPFATLG